MEIYFFLVFPFIVYEVLGTNLLPQRLIATHALVSVFKFPMLQVKFVSIETLVTIEAALIDFLLLLRFKDNIKIIIKSRLISLNFGNDFILNMILKHNTLKA